MSVFFYQTTPPGPNIDTMIINFGVYTILVELLRALGYLSPGHLEGEGSGKGWVRGGQFTSNLRPRWTDPVSATRVPSKWKREQGEYEE